MKKRGMTSDTPLITCPRCGTEYDPAQGACPHCTLVLPDTPQTLQTRRLKRMPTFTPPPLPSSGVLTPQHVVLVQALPSGHCFALPAQGSVVLGRNSADVPQDAYLLPLDDLDAQNHGVSRQHCRLDRHGSELTVTDLGSTNGTYLNERRLEQHRPYPLVHGDRLILGSLHLAIFFVLSSEQSNQER